MRKHHRELGAGPWGARTTRLRRPQSRRSSVSTFTSTAFRTTFVTIAIRPSPARNGTKEITISEKTKENYFCAEVLNTATILMRFWNFEFSHTRFLCRQSERCGEIGTDLPGRCRAPPTSGCSRMKSGDGLGRMSACEVVLPISHRRQSCLR